MTLYLDSKRKYSVIDFRIRIQVIGFAPHSHRDYYDYIYGTIGDLRITIHHTPFGKGYGVRRWVKITSVELKWGTTGQAIWKGNPPQEKLLTSQNIRYMKHKVPLTPSHLFHLS